MLDVRPARVADAQRQRVVAEAAERVEVVRPGRPRRAGLRSAFTSHSDPAHASQFLFVLFLQDCLYVPTYVEAVLCVLVDVVADILHDEEGLPRLMGDVTVAKITKLNIEMREIFFLLSFSLTSLSQHI